MHDAASSPHPAPWRISGNLVDPVARCIRPATLTIAAGRIECISDDPRPHASWILPGFVDAHVHVESSLLPPTEFARLAVAHGTVATVSDPHEIANVLGIAGVEYMLDDARRSPFKFHFGAPSCVPATVFDHAGATIDATGVAALLDRPDVGYLSEVMNYPGGISTDHECFTLDEALGKIALGMRILIREGSAARNFDALASLIDTHPEHCMLCSDDKHPDQLIVGHIDQLVRRAIARGSNLFDVLQAASVNPARHYRLPIGLLQVGDPADFIEVDDLESLRIRRVFVDGVVAAVDGATTWPRLESTRPNRFAASPKQPADFEIRASASDTARMVRVIEALDGQLVTGSLRMRPHVVEGFLSANPADDVLKIAVVDRYDDRPPAVALVHNFGLTAGAIASSVSHDSHNIVAVGTSDTDLARAVNLVIAGKGGLSVVGPGGEAILPLPIAGLMSDRPGVEVAAAYADIDRRAKALGTRLAAPYMTLSFMALLVIPALKLGPQGLFDVDAFGPVGLFD